MNHKLNRTIKTAINTQEIIIALDDALFTSYRQSFSEPALLYFMHVKYRPHIEIGVTRTGNMIGKLTSQRILNYLHEP